MLELRALVKHFPAAEPVRAIDGISLSITPGELVALYGPSGSGKSTLLELIAGLLEPDSGSIIFDGQDISRLTDRQRAAYLLRSVGLIGQPRTLLDGALAWENAAVKLWRIDPRKAKKLIEPLLGRLGLEDRVNFVTNQLSEGEQDRVMLAQALSTNPRLLLADEPTAHLDSQRTVEILELFQEICREHETAVLLATHNRLAADYADRVYELGDGRVQQRSSLSPL